MATQYENTAQLSAQQVADRLGFTLHRVEMLAQAGHLQGYRMIGSGAWQITLSSVRAFEGGRTGQTSRYLG